MIDDLKRLSQWNWKQVVRIRPSTTTRCGELKTQVGLADTRWVGSIVYSTLWGPHTAHTWFCFCVLHIYLLFLFPFVILPKIMKLSCRILMDINECIKCMNHWLTLIFFFFSFLKQMEEMENVNDQVRQKLFWVHPMF